ncbi:DUF421 domain-containing protein [Phocea massiliensis]|uniref:DUF421 domain-containing protein n=1 Tax=Merdimmobilis hominis TaxID=2897707 RepID=A0A938XB23_9FIRM|nr:DUF421 domain-containing protein [Merdimmobilis hominis]MBM6921904.1 DUF421 domain-containing protein [Merdimmobilis hominis]
MLVVFFRALFLYFFITLGVRLMGKRQLGELQPAEFVIAILISNIASLPIEDTSIPMVIGIIPIFVLVACEVIVSGISLKSRRFRSIISGRPVVVIHDGVIDQEKLRTLRFSVDDLLASLRQQNVFDVSTVWYAIVETTGKVSVIQKYGESPVTSKELHLTGQNETPPDLIISDGKFIHSNEQTNAELHKKAEALLKNKHLTVRQVFLMTGTKDGAFTIVKKAQRGKSS